MKYYLAIDIGASSGRHIVGWQEDCEIMTEEVYRFPNGMVKRDGHLVWDVEELFTQVKAGIRAAFSRYPKIESLSIDTWGVDYVLMRGENEVMPAYAYRDYRMDEAIPLVHGIIPEKEIYARTGVMFNTFNTIYQLYSDKLMGRLDGVTDFLMMPEYLMYKLTGNKVKEFTDASTTALLNAKTREFDSYVFEKLGLPASLMAPLYQPGAVVGELKSEIANEVGGNLTVVLCATHDTGSAVEAIDMETLSPYISSGTWSLLGVKTDELITDETSRLSGYSNEGGVGYNRYQKNITGMWIIQSLKKELCPDISFDGIVELAKASGYSEIFDVNDKAFLAPDSMKTAIIEYFKERGKTPPVTDGDLFSSAYHSLAYGYKVAIEDLERNTGRAYPEIYIVGGGAKNRHLNALTEEYTGKRVVALPIEATAIGNLKCQIRRNSK